MKENEWITIDQYNKVRVESYKGNLSIVLGLQGQNDTVYSKWCTPQKWSAGQKKPLKKNGEFVFLPWAINLGTDPDRALKIVGALYKQTQGME